MVKKVTLDSLDIEEQEIPLLERTLPVEEESNARPARRLAAKWLWISMLALVLLISAVGASYWLIGGLKEHAPRLPGRDVLAAVPLTPGPATAQVNDFIIPSQDTAGKHRIMICDLTLELSAGQDAIVQKNIVEIRKIIYELLQKARVASPLERESKNGLKEDINNSVSRLLGADVIKAVYFTKFVVL